MVMLGRAIRSGETARKRTKWEAKNEKAKRAAERRGCDDQSQSCPDHPHTSSTDHPNFAKPYSISLRNAERHDIF